MFETIDGESFLIIACEFVNGFAFSKKPNEQKRMMTRSPGQKTQHIFKRHDQSMMRFNGLVWTERA